MRVFTLSNWITTDRWTDGPTDQRTDGRNDKASYKVACPRLKRRKEERQSDRLVKQTDTQKDRQTDTIGERQKRLTDRQVIAGWINDYYMCVASLLYPCTLLEKKKSVNTRKDSKLSTTKKQTAVKSNGKRGLLQALVIVRIHSFYSICLNHVTVFPLISASFNRSFIHSFILSFIYSFIYPFMYPIIHSFIAKPSLRTTSLIRIGYNPSC